MDKIELLKQSFAGFMDDYPFLYETHMHTKESSACGADTAVDMAKAHKRAGYSGMIITNHNWGGNTCVDRSLPWTQWIDTFFEPYYLAKEWADKNDFQVFYGYEAGYDGTEFLIYGVTIDYLKNHPEIKDATVEEQFQIIHEGGGIVIHAHPYREAWYIEEIRLFPDSVDGVEGINAMHSSPFVTEQKYTRNFNEDALRYAREHGFVITGGSDTHCTDLVGGGMAFAKKLASINDFCDRIRNVRDYVVTDGGIITDPFGGIITK